MAAAMQEGRADEAKKGWQELLAAQPADSLISAAQQALAEVDGRQATQ